MTKTINEFKENEWLDIYHKLNLETKQIEVMAVGQIDGREFMKSATVVIEFNIDTQKYETMTNEKDLPVLS